MRIFWFIADRIFLLSLFIFRLGPVFCSKDVVLRASFFKRWKTLLVKGLNPFRYRWPGIFAMEFRPKIWRYVAFLEGLEFFPCEKKEDESTQHILVENVGHIGDVLHSFPLLSALRKQYSGARITYLCGPWNRRLLEEVAEVDEVLTYTPDLLMAHRGSRGDVLSRKEEWAFFKRLRERSFDLLVTTTNSNFVEYVVAQAVQPVAWAGVPWGLDLYRFLATRYESAYDYEMYEAERVGGLVSALGVELPEPLELSFPLQEKAAVWAREWLAENNVGAFIALAPGAGWDGKRWEADRFGALAEQLVEALDVDVVFFGTEAEVSLVRASGEGIYNLVGKTSLQEMAALLSRARLFVCNDSGPMHVAACFRVPVLSLFGSTRAAKWAPRYEGCVAIRKVDACSGCWHWHPSASCVHDGSCMKKISVEEVLREVKRVMAAVNGCDTLGECL